MNIVFIQTGGSIDKAYPREEDNHGYNFQIREAAFEKVLKRINPLFQYVCLSVLKKDSLDINDADRVAIVSEVIACDSEKVIVTHGTDTMHVTAEKIAEQNIPKTIIITGSNVPELFKDSDADFNLGMAVAGAQVLPRGVYIALNGLLQPWNEYRKQ